MTVTRAPRRVAQSVEYRPAAPAPTTTTSDCGRGMAAGYGTRMGTPVLLTHPSSLGHDTGGHPEQAARIPAVLRAIDEASGLGWDRAESPEVSPARLAAIHPEDYIDGIERLCLSGGGWIDADTVVSEGSWEAAL